MNLENNPLKLSNLYYGFNVNNSIKLRNKISLEVSGNYDSPGYFGLAKWKANGSFNIGIQKVLGDKWGMIRFNATDLLQSTNWFGTTNQPENNLLVDVSFQFAERTFMLSYSNTFGNNKLKSSRSRQTGSAEEMKRI